jgi:hypothetical protein
MHGRSPFRGGPRGGPAYAAAHMYNASSGGGGSAWRRGLGVLQMLLALLLLACAVQLMLWAYSMTARSSAAAGGGGGAGLGNWAGSSSSPPGYIHAASLFFHSDQQLSGSSGSRAKGTRSWRAGVLVMMQMNILQFAQPLVGGCTTSPETWAACSFPARPLAVSLPASQTHMRTQEVAIRTQRLPHHPQYPTCQSCLTRHRHLQPGLSKHQLMQAQAASGQAAETSAAQAQGSLRGSTSTHEAIPLAETLVMTCTPRMLRSRTPHLAA